MNFHRVCDENITTGTIDGAEELLIFPEFTSPPPPPPPPPPPHTHTHVFSVVRVVHVVQIHVFHVLSLMENDVRCVSTPLCFVEVHDFSILFVFIYAVWCPSRFPYQIILISFNSNKMGATNEAVTGYHPEHHHHRFDCSIFSCFLSVIVFFVLSFLLTF